MDAELLVAINDLRSPALDAALGPLGEHGYLLYPAFLVALLVMRRRAVATTTRDGLLAFLLALFVTETFLKPLFARPRPTAIPELLAQLDVLGSVPGARSWSMPSGTAAACGAGAAWIWSRLGWRAGLPAAIIAVLACFARLYAGVHWPTDLLFGATLGIFVALGVDRFSRWAG
ncbi:phosphatase PAP2 family protein [Sandaracinus amylolyticus]|uniref:Phosphoesterase, PA-phosphatase n=1 Tax=Sandaracinus amylolyticus TaxID=927083 RepID=A0A0F6W7P1_9BACT|nr:phosphatase PAP2 family protein [Sandaracinus amylolyticus]AKF09383.1 phosphoesterase, PA-phosphatase [Sandaracinus amylolyticus]